MALSLICIQIPEKFHYCLLLAKVHYQKTPLKLLFLNIISEKLTGNEEIIKALIEGHANVNIMGFTIRTPLSEAIEKGILCNHITTKSLTK